MPTKFLKSLKYFDFFGVSPVLYFQNGGKAKSSFGSFCSYLMIAYIILSVIYSFSDMVQRNNPKVVTSVVKADPDGIPFTQNGFNIGFGFTNPFTGEVISDPGILQNRVMHYNILYEEGGGKFLGITSNSIPYENCTKDHFNQAFTDIGFCVPKDHNVTVNTINSQQLVYQLIRCKNTTNSTTCKPKEEIDQVYMNNLLYLAYPKYLVTPGDYKNPITISRGVHGMTGSLELSKLFNVELMEYEVHTDSGFVFEDISIEKFIQIERIWIDTSKDGHEGMSVRMYTLEEKTILKRSYPKIQEAFAGAVALVRIGFLLCGFLIIPSAKVNYFQQIIEKTFKNGFAFNKQDISSKNLRQQAEKIKNSEIELELKNKNQLNYEKLQSSNCSEIAQDQSFHNNDSYQSQRREQNKTLQNAILSNHKKLAIEKDQIICLKFDQTNSEINKEQESPKISEDVVDFEQISIQMREKEGKEGVKVQSETQDQINSNLEPSKQESKLENFQNHFQFSDNTSNSNQKQKPSLVMWFRSSISCLKNKSSQDFKKKQQIIKQELSMTNLIRKLIEFDRLKEVLLEPDQQKLFNNIELFKKKVSVEHSKLVESKKDKLEVEDIYKMYNKQNKTNIDKKILEYYINNE